MLDFRLIGGTALDVLRVVRQPLRDMIVIVLTNYPEPVYRRACMKAGANWFLDKSTQFQEIETIVSGLVSQRTTSIERASKGDYRCKQRLQ